ACASAVEFSVMAILARRRDAPRLRPSASEIEAPSVEASGVPAQRACAPFPRLQIACTSLYLAAMTPQDITKLIVSTSLKDRAAFDLLYRQTSAKLFGVCLRVLNDRAEAEEALQEVLVDIWNKADQFVVC